MFREKGKCKSLPIVRSSPMVPLSPLPSPHPFLPQNSIRHNLSLHSRFVRVQNEGTGKSSWWMLNPEGGKSGKSPRRRAASMDNNSKFTKSRGRAAKKKVICPCVIELSVCVSNETIYKQVNGWPRVLVILVFFLSLSHALQKLVIYGIMLT